jgi:arylsulfatase A-like enzyme
MLALSSCAVSTKGSDDGGARRPNIVLILADDLGYGDLGCYGAKDVQTPHIDSIAAHGIRFTDYYANSPVCSPSRSALLSGFYPQHTGVWKGIPERVRKEWRQRKNPRKKHHKKENHGKAEKNQENLGLKAEIQLLPQFLRRAGYTGGMFGKWHLGHETPNLPNARGFDTFFGFPGGSSEYGSKRGQTLRWNHEPNDEEGHLTDLFSDKASQFIRENKDKPFFVYVPYYAPHGPIDAAASMIPDIVKKYRGLGVDEKRADYCAVVEHMDAGIGKILATLRDIGIEDNTLVIFTSDNGAAVTKWSGSNGMFRGEKGQVFEGGIRVPCVMRWPGVIPDGTVSHAPVAGMDIFRTLLADLDQPVPVGVSGVDLSAHLQSGGKAALPDRNLFFELKGHVALRQGRWKIVGDYSDEINHSEFALYDLSLDPKETEDVSTAHQEIFEDMRTSLEHWLGTVDPHKGLPPREKR